MEKFAQRFCLLQDFLPNRHNWSLILESKSIITVDPFYSLSSFVHLLVVEEKWRMICATGCAGNLIEFYSASTRLFQLSCKQDKSSNFSTFCFNVKPPVPCCTLLPQLPLCTVCLPRRWKWWELHQTRLVSGILTASQQRRRRSSVSKRMDLTLQRLSTPADSHLCQTSRGDAGIWCCTKWRRQSFGSDLQVNPQYFVGMWVSSGAPLVATGSQAGSQLATDAVNNATQCSVPPLYTFHTTPHTANPLGVHTSALCSVWVSRCITQCRTRTVRGVGGEGGVAKLSDSSLQLLFTSHPSHYIANARHPFNFISTCFYIHHLLFQWKVTLLIHMKCIYRPNSKSWCKIYLEWFSVFRLSTLCNIGSTRRVSSVE